MSGRGNIRAFTLSETLVAMLVTGILLLAVMEGLGLFFRLQMRQTEALLAAGSDREGYYRTERLVAAADSVTDRAGRLSGETSLRIWRGGRAGVLALGDSVLHYAEGSFRDTLLRGVAALRRTEGLAGADTVEVGFREGFTVRFVCAPSGRERHDRAVETIENGYGYEEE